MPYYQDFTGCKTIFYADQSGKKLGQASIIRHDRTNSLITVAEDTLDFPGHERFVLLILYQGLPYEYRGTVRHQPSTDTREVALYKGRTKEDRAARRYTVNAPARVERVMIGSKSIPLPRPLDVVVLNVSTDGILMRTRVNALNIGTSFQLIMDIDGSETVLNTTVVRINKADKIEAEYGCRFTSLQEL